MRTEREKERAKATEWEGKCVVGKANVGNDKKKCSFCLFAVCLCTFCAQREEE